jgi:hypothetical protein
MHHHRRLATGREPTKYFGKWRFTRVLGLQEIASVLFSLGNGYAHVHFLLNKQRVPKSYWARDLFLMYAVVAINTWVWSTVFHARYHPSCVCVCVCECVVNVYVCVCVYVCV